MTGSATVRISTPDLELSATLAARPGQTLLASLVEIQRDVDERLGLRSNCGTGQCGVCGVRVDGRLELACRVPFEAGRVYEVEPIDPSTHLQGLVCDISDVVSEFFLNSGSDGELLDKQTFESLLCRAESLDRS